jgi:hypothetical protein
MQRIARKWTMSLYHGLIFRDYYEMLFSQFKI